MHATEAEIKIAFPSDISIRWLIHIGETNVERHCEARPLTHLAAHDRTYRSTPARGLFNVGPDGYRASGPGGPPFYGCFFEPAIFTGRTFELDTADSAFCFKLVRFEVSVSCFFEERLYTSVFNFAFRDANFNQQFAVWHCPEIYESIDIVGKIAAVRHSAREASGFAATEFSPFLFHLSFEQRYFAYGAHCCAFRRNGYSCRGAEFLRATFGSE